jgi:hypothetical protein
MAPRFVLLGALGAVSLLRPALACKCEEPADASAALAKADLAFHRPVARRPTRVLLGHDGQGNEHYVTGWTYEFVVERLWKGEPRERLLVASMWGSCGVHFVREARYLVFAHREPSGRYDTWRCEGDTRLDDDRRDAGGWPPGPPFPAPESPSRRTTYLALGVVATALTALVALRLRRRRRA